MSEPEPDPELDEELEQIAEQLEQQGEPEVTNDWQEATAVEEENWSVPTGRTKSDGTPIHLEVTVSDPQDPSILVAFISSQDRRAATRSLFKACVVSPAEIVREENFEQLSSAFITNMQFRLLGMLGLSKDFLEQLEKMGMLGGMQPAQAQSSTGSLDITDETREKLRQATEAARQNFSEPSDTQSEENSGSDDTSSRTSASSSPTPSAKTESTTPSKKKQNDENEMTTTG